MASQIDFAFGVSLFIIFTALLLSYLIAYITNITGSITSSTMRASAYDIYRAMFSGKGMPSNWENYPYTPVRVGFVMDLYRTPIVITEKNGTARNNITVNISVTYDLNCESRTWNNTVRLYDGNNSMITSSLFNQSFCSDQYLNTADLVFNISLAANQNKTFFAYFSSDKEVQPPNYTIEFQNTPNYTALAYPEEKLSSLSITKLGAVRNKTYEDVMQTLGGEYEFNIEIEAA